MDISRRTDYAIRILVKLALQPEEVLSVRELSEAQDIPYSFARSIQRDLAKASFVETTRGVSGGVVLARPAEEIDLYQVVDAMQGPISCSICSADPSWCERMSDCPVHPIWVGIDAVVRERLEHTKLSDVAEGLLDGR